MLTVSKLSKVLPDGKPLLKEVSFEVGEGEMVGILGLSGVGKTVLLRCLNRLTEPDGGDVFLKYNGTVLDVAGWRDRELREIRRHFAMVFQSFNLVGRLTALENVLVGRLGCMSTLKGIVGRFSEEDKDAALSYLERLGVGHIAHRRAETLSGGEQQRVAFARARFQGCHVLLADEPVANLDPRTADEVMMQLAEITEAGGICTLAVMHQPDLVRKYCQRVLGIKDGVVVYDGKADLSDEDLDYIYDRKAADASKVA